MDFKFESETDTESVAFFANTLRLTATVRKPDFTSLIKSVVKELEGGSSRLCSNLPTTPARWSSHVVVRLC